MLRAIRMYLWPKMDNVDNPTWQVITLGCAQGTKFTPGISPWEILLLIYIDSYHTYVVVLVI